MPRLIQRGLTALFVLFVVGGIGFGASQAFGSTRVTTYCGEQPEDMGCCPPFNEISCNQVCLLLVFPLGGACISTDGGDPCDHCCTCIDL